MTLGVTRGWSKTDREIIGTQRFENQPWNLTFETTPYQWYFEDVWLEGKTYVHAYSDSLIDFMVPKTERHTICAPKSFVEQYKLEQENKKKQDSYWTTQQEKYAFQQKVDNHATEFSKAFFEETVWASLNADRAINQRHYTEAKTYANAALRYYEQAIEALKPVGYFVDDVLKDMVTPGGIDALRKFKNGEITAAQYDIIVKNDIASDAAASALGSIIGGPTAGSLGAVVGGPVGATAASKLGYASGAAIGYIASRATKAVARATVDFFKGNGSCAAQQRTVADRKDADNYIDKLIDKGVLSEKKIAKDKREYFEFRKKCEYMGIKFKKGQYLERDTMHHEWEYFRDKNTHLGAIDPLTGELNTAKRDLSRTLKIQ